MVPNKRKLPIDDGMRQKTGALSFSSFDNLEYKFVLLPEVQGK